MTKHRLDGAQIKAAAITARVPIQPGFVLSLVLPGGKQKIIPDDGAFTRARRSGWFPATTTRNAVAELKQAVASGAEITAACGAQRVRVIPDGQG